MPARGQTRQRLVRRQPRARAGRLLFANQPLHFLPGCFLEPRLFQRRGAGEQFVKNDAEGVNVGPRVHVQGIDADLLGCHVQRRADDRAVGGVQRPIGEHLRGVERLGQAEVDHLRHRLAVVLGHEHVRRLQIAVDDSLLVGVLDR